MSYGIIQLPADDTGKRVRAIYTAYSGVDNYVEVIALANASGDLIGIGQPLLVDVSGQTVDMGTHTNLITISDTIGAISGGTQLTSGIVVSVAVKAASWNSGDIYLGGSDLAAGWRPYSGVGMQLQPGDGVSMDIDNINRLYAFAEVSGDVVLTAGVAK